MTDDYYKQALDVAIDELTELLRQRDDLENKREELDKRIVKLRQGVFGLSNLMDEGDPLKAHPDLFPDSIDPEVGFTDAVREVLTASRTAYISPVRLRDKLQARGYDLSKYKNVLASLHTVLKRLVENGEAEVDTREGKTVYRARRRLAVPPPTRTALPELPGLASGIMRRMAEEAAKKKTE